MAVGRVVVDHADGLHKGVEDGRAHKGHAALLEGLAHGIRLGGGRGPGFLGWG